jgi:hypothetical protein
MKYQKVNNYTLKNAENTVKGMESSLALLVI